MSIGSNSAESLKEIWPQQLYILYFAHLFLYTLSLLREISQQHRNEVRIRRQVTNETVGCNIRI